MCARLAESGGRGVGGQAVKRVAVAALAIAALAPGRAWAAVVMTAPAAQPFDLTELLDGTGRVLASVGDDVAGGPRGLLPTQDGPAALGLSETGARRADAAARVNAAYAAANAASLTDPIPEPTTWLMMILGFFGLSFAVRRRGQGSGTRVRFSE